MEENGFSQLFKVNKYDRDQVVNHLEWDYVGIKEAAKILGISVSKMEKISAKREIPIYKPCGKVYVKIQDLRAYLESSRQASRFEIEESALTRMQSLRKKSDR